MYTNLISIKPKKAVTNRKYIRIIRCVKSDQEEGLNPRKARKTGTLSKEKGTDLSVPLAALQGFEP